MESPDQSTTSSGITSPETTEKLANWTLLTWPQSLPIEEANTENEEEKATDTE